MSKEFRLIAGSLALAVALTTLAAASAAAAPAVATTTVNLRQGPGTNYPIIGKIPGGAGVDVAGCSGQWCQVGFAGRNGYVIASALGSGAPPPAYAPPPGYAPPPPPAVYVVPPPVYFGYGPYWGGGWHRGWRR
jgi:Bacterial SH3 domain